MDGKVVHCDVAKEGEITWGGDIDQEQTGQTSGSQMLVHGLTSPIPNWCLTDLIDESIKKKTKESGVIVL